MTPRFSRSKREVGAGPNPRLQRTRVSGLPLSRQPSTGWSSLGVTVAATHAEDTEQIRVALPRALFLVLGYGAQGASAREAVRGFRRGPAGLEGGIVSSSRPILFPAASSDASARAWEQGVRSALARATSELGEAIV